MRTAIATGLLILTAGLAAAQQADLAFHPGEKGYYRFDTGLFRGQMRLDGRSQGICPLVYVPSGLEIAKAPGLLSYYRVLATNARYGKAVRDWPSGQRVLPGGALEVTFAEGEGHPLRITGVFRWTAPNTLDLETTVVSRVDMPRMELFMSSYFSLGFAASVYVKAGSHQKCGPLLVRADDNPLIDGTYLMFPRDDQAAQMIFDGRWTFPPNPVQWSVTRDLAAPIAVRRDAASGLCAVLMSPPEDCFAVATPYNKTPPDGVAGHSSLYLSLFGRDLKSSATARAQMRLVIDRNLDDKQVVGLYESYLRERKAEKGHAP